RLTHSLEHFSMQEDGSSSLGIKQVQAMLKIVGETAELWYDATLQRRYTLESLCRLLPAKAGVCFNFGDVLAGASDPCGPMVQAGLPPEHEEMVQAYLRLGRPVDPCIGPLSQHDGRVVVKTRAQLVKDKPWRASEHFQKLRKEFGLDDS